MKPAVRAWTNRFSLRCGKKLKTLSGWRSFTGSKKKPWKRKPRKASIRSSTQSQKERYSVDQNPSPVEGAKIQNTNLVPTRVRWRVVTLLAIMAGLTYID